MNIALKTISPLFLIASTITPAFANTPRGRCVTAIIQSVNPARKEIVVGTDHKPDALTIGWNNRTVFVAGTELANAAILSRGASFQITYQSPFFGERFASRIVLLAKPPLLQTTNQPVVNK
jgi:hypothetical protein